MGAILRVLFVYKFHVISNSKFISLSSSYVLIKLYPERNASGGYIMLRHILIPLDGSALSEQALYYAQEILAQGGRFTLLSVLETPLDYQYSMLEVPMTVMSAPSESDYSRSHQHLEEYLKNKAQKLAERGYEVETIVEVGDPASVIVDTASAKKVNTIVMTTHGRTGLSRWLFGSVTQKVISKMPCPVMVVPGIQPVESAEAVPVAEAKPAVATT
jgi:nucleotide-binding universal stress UspA family protein